MRLRTVSNQPLELSTLFIYSRCEPFTSESLLSSCESPSLGAHARGDQQPDVATKKSSKTLLARLKEASMDSSKQEKDVSGGAE